MSTRISISLPTSPTHLLSRLSWFTVSLSPSEALGRDGALRRLHDELRGQELLHVFQDVTLHLQRHVVHVVVRRVVHDGVLKHQHDVSLELSRGADHTGLYVLLYG